jgi:DNA-binding NtrC family response regulator
MTVNSKNVLLLGLNEMIQEGLEKALAPHGKAVHARRFLSAEQCVRLIDQLSADVVFCAAEPDRYRPLLAAVNTAHSPVPVVVVGRPEVSDWLDALEAGASDYCAPPFEEAHLGMLVQAAMKSKPLAKARAVA